MSKELSYKKNYLEREILLQGYDPETFEEYLIHSNPLLGSDLEKWKMSELIKVV